MIQLTKRELFISIQIIFAIFLAIYWLRPTPDNSLQYEINGLLKEREVLQKQLDSISFANAKMEKELREKITNDEQKYKKIIKDLELKFLKEKNRLKELTFDEHVVLLDSNLSQVGDTLRVQKLDGDTLIAITPNQMRFLNDFFLTHTQTVFLLNVQSQRLNELEKNLSDCLNLLNLKTTEVNHYKLQINTEQKINKQLNDIIKHNQKLQKRKNLEYALWGSLVGAGQITTQIAFR